ncbi:MAG TPA: hypothetical protein VF584_22100 [Longimicrobium sp.]|jgi:hypothetical protein
MANRKILLIEPGYKNKYPPLGLMKIAQYHGPYGKKDRVRFIKGEDRSVLSETWDRIYITTLFSFEWKRIAAAIDFALEVANGASERIFVGGIAVSLMHQRFLDQPHWRGIRFIQGLLDQAPAISLQLDDFAGEFYSDDIDGRSMDDHVPDYSILDQIEYKYPVRDAYFAYASRGCIRKCSFCGVPKLEGDLRETESISYIVRSVEERYGAKKDLVLMDNNVVAAAKFREIIAEIRDLGFEAGAKLHRGRVPVQRRVDFNQGVDARILCKDPMYLRELATICLSPLRIAFDHLGLKKPYTQAVRYAHDVGLTNLSNYMLYNFHDSPSDLFERMRLNVALNEDLGIRIFSFPMRFQPTDRPDRGHVGEKWNRHFLRSMQVVLQATGGIVSGSPQFFKRAFGDTYEEFESILIRPQRMIFNREWYETMDGKPEFEQYQSDMGRLSASERAELLGLLAVGEPAEFPEYARAFAGTPLARVLEHYFPLTRSEEQEIWTRARQARLESLQEVATIPDDELVEDAGLYDEDIPLPANAAVAEEVFA